MTFAETIMALLLGCVVVLLALIERAICRLEPEPAEPGAPQDPTGDSGSSVSGFGDDW